MEEYQFGEAQRVVHDFLWGEYCDWYIEMAKVRIRSDDGPSPLPYLAYVLERVLRLLHPFMPFVTEEVWQSLSDYIPVEPDWPDALIVAAYPEADASLFDADAESEVGTVIELVRAIRNMRAEFRIQPNQRLEAVVESGEIVEVTRAEEETIRALARVEPITYGSGEREANSDSVALVLSAGTVNIPLGGLVDLQKERERLSDERSEIDASLDTLSKRLGDKQFLSKAPEEVVERERLRLEGLEERKGRIDEILSRL
jgi:valyl-tRNA synthetase